MGSFRLPSVILSWFSLLALLSYLLWYSAAALANSAAGVVLFAHGDVRASSAQGTRVLEKADQIYSQDEITTADNGRVQLRFSDGGLVSLMPNSHFSIEEYLYDATDEDSSAAFGLLKGGLRTVTGAIGKVKHEQYKLKTPVATLGIRGTEFTVVLSSANTLRVHVGQGKVVLNNDAGSMEVEAGQNAEVRFEAPPRLSDEAPAFRATAPTGDRLSTNLAVRHDPHLLDSMFDVAVLNVASAELNPSAPPVETVPDPEPVLPEPELPEPEPERPESEPDPEPEPILPEPEPEPEPELPAPEPEPEPSPPPVTPPTDPIMPPVTDPDEGEDDDVTFPEGDITSPDIEDDQDSDIVLPELDISGLLVMEDGVISSSFDPAERDLVLIGANEYLEWGHYEPLPNDPNSSPVPFISTDMMTDSDFAPYSYGYFQLEQSSMPVYSNDGSSWVMNYMVLGLHVGSEEYDIVTQIVAKDMLSSYEVVSSGSLHASSTPRDFGFTVTNDIANPEGMCLDCEYTANGFIAGPDDKKVGIAYRLLDGDRVLRGVAPLSRP